MALKTYREALREALREEMIRDERVLIMGQEGGGGGGGQSRFPGVAPPPAGWGQLAATHSQTFESWFAHIPGLTVVMPSTPADAKGLLKTAIRSENPVMFIEHARLYGTKGEVPEVEYTLPMGVRAVKREGREVTIVPYSRMGNVALEAAESRPRGGNALQGVG